MRKKKQTIHPEHATWWDRNQVRVLLFLAFHLLFLLVLAVRALPFIISEVWIAVGYIVLLQLNAILLYVLFTREKE